MEHHLQILLFILMPLAAFLYSSVGHGGASSYIVLLTLFGFLPAEVRPAALVLNIGVSAISFLTFHRKCDFPYKFFLILILFSIPAAYLGGTFTLDAKVYQKILGLLLLLPIARLFNLFRVKEGKPVPKNFLLIAFLSFSIGFISGIIGIGGGILLSPILIFFGWADLKQTAAISGLFIFLNSIAGLLGTGATNFSWLPHFELIIPLTLAGGIAGGYLGANKYSPPAMKYALAIVLSIASVKFLI